MRIQGLGLRVEDDRHSRVRDLLQIFIRLEDGGVRPNTVGLHAQQVHPPHLNELLFAPNQALKLRGMQSKVVMQLTKSPRFIVQNGRDTSLRWYKLSLNQVR